jgi:acyl-CoA synthetase (AMP-forming)/AMP-acid ligase II
VDESTVESAWSSRKAQDTALLLYTSGTTTDPKGCELTHEALVRSWSAYADPVGFEPDQSMWTPCPFFHVGGIGVTVSALVRGATMMSMNWFEPKVALAHIEKRQAEHLFPAFPPLTLGLLRAPGYDPGRLTFVRTILNVAPADTQRVIENLLPEQAVLLTDFGMTEGAGMITVTPRDAAGEDRLSRNGTPRPASRSASPTRKTRRPISRTMCPARFSSAESTPSGPPTRSPAKSASSPTGPCQRPRSGSSACASCCYSVIRRPCGRRMTCDVTHRVHGAS